MALLIISAGVNVLQARRIQSLMVEQASAATVIGQSVAGLDGFSASGAPVHIALRGGLPTVVYFFSPTCSWCERNWANVQALAARALDRYRVLAVTASRGTAAYLRSRGIEVDVLEGISDNMRKDLGLSGTPHTLVISSEGLITHDWRGAYTPRVERQIEELLGVVLPGVLAKGTLAKPLEPQ